MNIHEYQAKAVLRAFGAPVSEGKPAFTPDEAVAAAKALAGPLWVVKSQIHAGGRGKGRFKEASAGDKGGVRLARSIEEVREFAEQMLGATLVTVQTGPAGKQVNRLYIEDGADDRQGTLSLRAGRSRRPAASPSSCRPRAASTSRTSRTTRRRKSITFSIDPATGVMPHHGRAAARGARPDRRSRQADARR